MIRFDEWVALYETAAHQAEGLLKAVEKLEDRPNRSTGEIAAVERLCARLANAAPIEQIDTRPLEIIPDEWREPAFTGARERLLTLRKFAVERSPNLDGWLRELRVGCTDFIDAWRWFNQKVER